jgi:hypothetical protein
VVLPASHGISRVPRYSGSVSERRRFRLQGCYLLWRTVPGHFVYPRLLSLHVRRPTTPPGKTRRFGLFPFRSPLLRESLLLSSPRGTKMFQFPRCAPVHPMCSGGGTSPRRTGGLPHSGILGSTLAYSSPRHIGVRPALHRLLAPRHPPCALTSFSSGLATCECLTLPYPIFKVQLTHCHSARGGAERDRTADLLRARQALSQLSYSPMFFFREWWA